MNIYMFESGMTEEYFIHPIKSEKSLEEVKDEIEQKMKSFNNMLIENGFDETDIQNVYLSYNDILSYSEQYSNKLPFYNSYGKYLTFLKKIEDLDDNETLEKYSSKILNINGFDYSCVFWYLREYFDKSYDDYELYRITPLDKWIDGHFK